MSGFDVFADCTRHGHALITVTLRPGAEQCVTCQRYFFRNAAGRLTPIDPDYGQESGPGRTQSTSRGSADTPARKRGTQRRQEPK